MLIISLLLHSQRIPKHPNSHHHSKISSSCSRTTCIPISSQTKYQARIAKCIKCLLNKVCKESARLSRNRRLFLVTITINYSNSSSSSSTCKPSEFHIKVIRYKDSTGTIRRCPSHLPSSCSSFEQHILLLLFFFVFDKAIIC